MKASYFLGILILISIYWMSILYQPFLMDIVIAVLLVLATSEIYALAMNYVKRSSYASIISTLFIGTLFFSPIIYFITTIAIELNQHDFLTMINDMITQLKVWMAHDFPDSLSFAKPYIISFIESDNITKFTTSALDIATSIGAKSAGFLSDILFIVIFYFFILLYGEELGDFFTDIIPLNPGHTHALYHEASGVMSVVFYSILVTAIFEGILFAILAYLFEYNALLFGILYGFASLIPIVGGALMWLPLSMYELSLGNTNSAIFIALYSIIIISIAADTFVKPIIIKYINLSIIKTKVPINEMIIFFAILAGLSTFGFWGMIIGPAITAFFVSLLNLYRTMRTKEHTESPIRVA